MKDTSPNPRKRKLREQKGDIEQELEKVFAASVSAAIGEAPAVPASPELVATIVLGVLLAATCIAFLAYVLLELKRKRKYGKQDLVKKVEIMEGIDNPWAVDKNGSLKSLEKPEHMNYGRTEMMSFDNLEGTGDDAEKDEIQAPEKDNYLETVLLDYRGESEQNGAAESRNVEVQPTVGFTTKQDSFPTDTNQKPAVSLTPHPTLPAPEKELKGVKFSEVAVILDAEPGDDESEGDASEGDEPGDDVSL